MKVHHPVLIGIAGGTGSGKTTVAHLVKSRFKGESVIIIHHDSYYRDRGSLPFEEREKVNYDHPSAFDNALLAEHLKILVSRKPIEMPVYDYSSHTRLPDRKRVNPAEIILLEGIL